ncbi:amino acid ABC transporter permease [Paradevosia shaoguanensis]|uniref:Amino acid ABC transporter permease n=1 Tax=Paradevosia shaoguanensis TaxID=1335043 RepID=A0AA41QNN3_9HYPH|nr:amino acid ABC transporter permease [Paradevosia shaoguanensis]MCF1742681.1 amino acid ABC transporter permease [Paradevosia shaoguanensis]MCI0127164.1 amino acid ABC transporter permease [Paradevosia shaoguanensis]
MAVIEPLRSDPPRTSIVNDPRFRGYFYQIVVVVAVILFFAWIIQNTVANLTAQNKTMGFDFLWKTSGFNVSFSLFPFDRASYYWEAFLVGITNTLLVSIIGIFFATIVGFILGIARLSSNWIIARLATLYVEVVRNIPLLLQLFFWYFAVLKTMPAVKQSHVFFETFVLNQRGLWVPQPLPDARFWWVIIAAGIAVVFGLTLRAWARKRQEATGDRFPVFLSFLVVLIVLPGIVWMVSGAHLDWNPPVLKGFNYVGGIELPPEFVALVFGLSIYTAAFIAEIVRAGILAVNRGQTEAAEALGLRDNDRLRLVVIPQAMRVIIPPLTSQYLNLTKNSSLGAAIGFPELVNVFTGTTLNQTGRAVEVIALTMVVYLTLSLTTSAIMNWYNARVALVER